MTACSLNLASSRPTRVALASVAAGMALVCSATAWAQAPATAAPAKPALTVSTVAPVLAPVAPSLQVHGNVVAWQDMVVASQVAGLGVTELRAQVGDSVKAGQVLLRLDDVPVRHDLAQAQAAVQEAQAQAREAAANGQRARSLAGTGALSEQQLGQFAAAEAAASARLASAQAALAQQERRLKHTQVVAPDDGVVSARQATQGAVVGMGQELYRLVRKGRLEWRAEVPSADLGRVKPGTAVRVAVPQGEPVAGVVRQVAPTVDPATRNGLVYVDLKLPEGSPLRAGMYVRGELRFDAQPALTVPASAVLRREGRDVVWVVDAQSRAKAVAVVVRQREGDRAVVEGLNAQAAVVSKGGAFLNEGDTVRVENGQ